MWQRSGHLRVFLIAFVTSGCGKSTEFDEARARLDQAQATTRKRAAQRGKLPEMFRAVMP
jgi:hypothetical protein